MLKTIIIIFYPIIIFLINYLLTKKNLIPNYSGDDHQKFFEKDKIQLSGGIFLIPIFVLISFEYSLILAVTIISIFLLGLLSDINFFFFRKIQIFNSIYYYTIFHIFFGDKINLSQNRCD